MAKVFVAGELVHVPIVSTWAKFKSERDGIQDKCHFLDALPVARFISRISRPMRQKSTMVSTLFRLPPARSAKMPRTSFAKWRSVAKGVPAA